MERILRPTDSAFSLSTMSWSAVASADQPPTIDRNQAEFEVGRAAILPCVVLGRRRFGETSRIAGPYEAVIVRPVRGNMGPRLSDFLWCEETGSLELG